VQVDVPEERRLLEGNNLLVVGKQQHAHGICGHLYVVVDTRCDVYRGGDDEQVNMRVEMKAEGCMGCIEGLTVSEGGTEVWLVRHIEGVVRRADGCFCGCLQEHYEECETVRCPQAYSWGQGRTVAAASGSQNNIHVPWNRSAVEGGRIDR